MFRRRHKPSEMLLRYIEGLTRDGELDAYVHDVTSEEEEQRFVQPLMDINRKYAVGPIPGIVNRDAFEELRELAQQLKAGGW